MKSNHTAHKEMWTWLAENPKMDKEDWPGWEWNGGRMIWIFLSIVLPVYMLTKLAKGETILVADAP